MCSKVDGWAHVTMASEIKGPTVSITVDVNPGILIMFGLSDFSSTVITVLIYLYSLDVLNKMRGNREVCKMQSL